MKPFFLIIGFSLISFILLASPPDSTVQVVYSWQLTETMDLEKIEVDTSMNHFHIFNPVDQYSFSNSFTGNYGHMAHSNEFSKALYSFESDFIFENTYRPFLITPKTLKSYNTTKPFSLIKYVASNKKNDQLSIDVLHTQNITKNLNIGGSFKIIASEDQVSNGRTKDISSTLFSSYLSDKYQIHGAFILNKIKLQELLVQFAEI